MLSTGKRLRERLFNVIRFPDTGVSIMERLLAQAELAKARHEPSTARHVHGPDRQSERPPGQTRRSSSLNPPFGRLARSIWGQIAARPCKPVRQSFNKLRRRLTN